MGLPINVRHDLNALEARLDAYPQEAMLAAVRALNRTVTTVRKEAAISMREEYPGVKAGALKARMKMQRATRQNPVAVLSFSPKRFALYDNFGMRAVGLWGVRFRKLPWRIETVSGEPVTAEMLDRAFRNRSTRNGRSLVLSRHTKVRTSHEVLVAPGLASAFVEQKIGEALVRVGRTRFAVVLVAEMKYQLGKRR